MDKLNVSDLDATVRSHVHSQFLPWLEMSQLGSMIAGVSSPCALEIPPRLVLLGIVDRCRSVGARTHPPLYLRPEIRLLSLPMHSASLPTST